MMDNVYQIQFVGWNNEGNHDKVWGWLLMQDGREFAFWGRRGKTLRFKEHMMNDTDPNKLSRNKIKKGYREIPPNQYNVLVKDFIDEVEIYCMTAILSDKVM